MDAQRSTDVPLSGFPPWDQNQCSEDFSGKHSVGLSDVCERVAAVYLENAKHYEFRYGVIMANAPRKSGVYALFKGAELLYVGEARNIFSRLIEHLLGGNCILMAEEPTAFAFELCPAKARTVRCLELIFKWRPPYTERPELKIQED